MIKRLSLFSLVNFLAIGSLSLVIQFFNLTPYITSIGIEYWTLMGFCFIWGMTGSFISLALSKYLAKKAFKITTITPNTLDPIERKIILMVHNCSKKAGLKKMPEVGYYESEEMNAFATGMTQKRSLIAVSTGLVHNMTEDQVEAVIAHEVGHVANGDMITMALLQGVVNSFVMFLSRAVAFGMAQAYGRRFTWWMIFYFTQMVLETILMFFGSLVVSHFSRRREYRADKFGAKIVGKEKMVSALEALEEKFQLIDNHPGYKTMKVAGKTGWFGLFSSHPKIKNRIKALNKVK